MAQPQRKKCEHGNYLCELCVNVSDAGKRFADGVNGLLSFNRIWEVKHHWLAIKLEDGSVNSTIYDTKAAALKDQHHNEEQYFYLPVGNFLTGLSYTDAECILQMSRMAYESGIRYKQEDTAPELVMPFEGQDKFRRMLQEGARLLS
jgi:hypothetical protein